MPWAPSPTDVLIGPVPGWWVEPPEPSEDSIPGWFSPFVGVTVADALVKPEATAEVEVAVIAGAVVNIAATAEVKTTHEAEAELGGEESVFKVFAETEADATVVINAPGQVFSPDAPAGFPYTFSFEFGAGTTVGFPYTFPIQFGGGTVPIRNLTAAPALVVITATASAIAVLEAPAAVSIIAFGTTASFSYEFPLTLS